MVICMDTMGFDNQKYLKMQSEKIRERISLFGDKLYLEFGGKLFDDYHASRVLPGFEPDSKVKMLLELKEQAEIVIVISADDIEANKIRGDLGITYDLDVLRLMDAFRGIGLFVGSVVLTRFGNQPTAVKFEKRLKSLGIRAYRHYTIEGYPSNISHIVSDEGYGLNDYIETERSLIVVTAPGPGSGKMAVCLSQLYHDNKRGIQAGYAKFETFPIWNIPLKHPVNLAYEAATADLRDVNLIDPFHLEAYGKTAVNYNRDVEIFPILRTVFEKINGKSPYNSPTDMGVNMVGNCIVDDEICCKASKNEIIRRYFAALCGHAQGKWGSDVANKIEFIMNGAKITSEDRLVAVAANKKEEDTDAPAAAIELKDGTVLTGKTSELLGASSALLLNSLKYLAHLDDCVHLLSPEIIEPIMALKINHFGNHNPRLHIDEILIALAICAVTDEQAKQALEQLEGLDGCDVHSSVILSAVDENMFRKLGINLTSEPKYQGHKLYHA